MAGKRRQTPICPYCEKRSTFLASSASLYGGRDFGPVYACMPCGAWVGCHPGTTAPLGRLADSELRRAKQAAHAAFDPLWKRKMRRESVDKGVARNAGYAWLAEQLGIHRSECHIGMFDVATCARVVAICAHKSPATNSAAPATHTADGATNETASPTSTPSVSSVT